MAIQVCGEPFDPWQAIEHHQQAVLRRSGQYGATAVFVGTMRDFSDGGEVRAMVLEHYPGMTESYLEKIADEAQQKWSLLDALIVHLVGQLQPNDPIVLVAVWSALRKEAFEACRWLMEELKSLSLIHI